MTASPTPIATASPTPVPTAETYSALQTHVVDGVETTLALFDGNRWQEVQKYISLTNHIWSNLYLLANPGKYAALPADIRSALVNNLCRCGTHQRIVRAVQRAAKA